MVAAETINQPEFAVCWAQRLQAREDSLVQLSGGINNQVYCCEAQGCRWVIKGYPRLQPGQRDRMRAEVDFLRYATQVAPGYTPKLHHVDLNGRCVVLEHLNGSSFPEGRAAPEEAVAAAVDFFRKLNADPDAAREAIHLEAAEGFLSLWEHLANVQERLAGMGCEHLEQPMRPQAKFLLGQLQDMLHRIEEQTAYCLEQFVLEETIHPDQRCVSPSDFGFHNAISTSSGVRFIDFEFAGWDDPAKAAVDFILQPRVPVNHEYSPLLDTLPPDMRMRMRERCVILAPILKLKWACILLSILRPERLEQILSVLPDHGSNTLIRDRLDAATVYISKSAASGI